ncbi:ComF family protein [bacterium c-19]|nr:ComF family protein [bacterium c-19]
MKRCYMCDHPINSKQDLYRWLKCDSLLCGACLRKLIPLRKTYQHQGMKLHVLYAYNEFIENMLFQYKEGLDTELRFCFLHEDRRYIEKRYKGHTLALMPSSKEKTQARGFHALAEMSNVLRLKKIQPFYKTEDRKQSSLNYEQRLQIGEIIRLDATKTLLKKKLVLFDDVCTSGATLTKAYELLKQENIVAEALVLCAHPLFIQNHT